MPELRGDRFERVLRYAESRARDIGVSGDRGSSFVDRHLCDWGRSCILLRGAVAYDLNVPAEVLWEDGRRVGVRVHV